MDLEQMVQRDMERLRSEGRLQGQRDGEKKGLRTAVLDLCEVFAVELTSERRAHVASLDLAGLEALGATLKQIRRWPG